MTILVEGNAHKFSKPLTPGLHQLTVDADAHEFDWESLYTVLNVYGNVNQRTGPWDFHLLEKFRPVVPAYWVFINGRKIGLWYFNRPSKAQVEARRFKGQAGFWIREAGRYEFRFEPYQNFKLKWENVRFEEEPDDQLLTSLPLKTEAHRALGSLFNAHAWRSLAEKLKQDDFPFRSLLLKSFKWAKNSTKFALPLLAADYRVRRETSTLTRACEVIENELALPAFGNVREDGYGHNGDINGSLTYLHLTLALSWLSQDLNPGLLRKLLNRLKDQGEIFMELALLHQGYWGGSILQEHGFLSLTNFTSAAYCLWERLPQAKEWLRFCLPRMQRTFRALPTDGVIPGTSFHSFSLYTDKLVLFRELHRSATGEDIYEFQSLRNIVNYLIHSYDRSNGMNLHPSTRGDLSGLSGGHGFLMQMATTFQDSQAAWLVREFLRQADSMVIGHELTALGLYVGSLWASLFYSPLPQGDPLLPQRDLQWFRDSGVIIYRDEPHGILFSSRCGPPNSLTSFLNTTCPCDRSNLAHTSGNFALDHEGALLIQTAEGGYRMESKLANVLLIDGRGQRGDYGCPMSCPDAPYGGEAIEEAKLDAVSGQGYARLNLANAYDPDLGLTEYTREWFFESDGKMRMVDTVASKQPHQFSWLFQTYRSNPITEHDGVEFTILNREHQLHLHLLSASAPIRSSVKDTLTVWAYVNAQNNQTCHHLTFETKEPERRAKVKFTFSCKKTAKKRLKMASKHG